MQWTVLLLAACFGEFPNRAGSFPDDPLHDYDKDQMTEQQGDCNDNDPNVQNGPWYLDADEDGFGDPENSTTECERDGNYVLNNADCNDNDVSIFPGNARYEASDACVQDLDGDGYGSMSPTVPADFGSDCDDTTIDVNPSTQEVCDDIDNNCNGEVDEYNGIYAPTWYGDADGDGYGNPDVVTYACTVPNLHVDNNFDCDDSDPSIYPNAPELCTDGDNDGDGLDDLVDNNCNGLIDENSALDVTVWFIDNDGDGYGSVATVESACERPSGFSANSEDCDDSNALVHPAGVESCNGLDDDCNQLVDEGSPATAPTWYLDSDGDGFGDPAFAQQACDQPTNHVFNDDDCDDSAASIYPNAPEYCNQADDDCDGSVDDSAVDSQVFYIDADADGRGEPSQTLIACGYEDGSVPAGYSAYSDDCDDNDPNRAPTFPELCTDSIDENCDGDTTFAAVDLSTFYADSDMDGYGNPALIIQLCEQPAGYVSNADDCDDTDTNVQPYLPVEAELCNGKIDRCETQSLQQVNEVDLDGDGYVVCDLDVDPLLWEDPSITPTGGGDCDDGNTDRYPGATELCNGIFEDCDNVNYGLQLSPDLESDDDGDGYIECTYDPSIWSVSTVVTGGDDCNDSSDLTYVGAASNYPTLCAQDADLDGEPDCNLTGIAQDYGCDYGVIYPNGTGPDFVLIAAGMDPLGRYELTRDYYMMTTEVTVGMYNTVMGGTDVYNTLAAGGDGKVLANQLSLDAGFDICYEMDGSTPTQEYWHDIASCPGYRLPTEAEWDFAARAGTTSDFWTGSGPDNGGTTLEQGCDYDTVITDGNLNPYLRDYAWFCGNSNAFQPVAQLLPNGNGLYDIYGNRAETVNDASGAPFPYGSFQNPNGPDNFNQVWASNQTKGAASNSVGICTPSTTFLGSRGGNSGNKGARLVRTVF